MVTYLRERKMTPNQNGYVFFKDAINLKLWYESLSIFNDLEFISYIWVNFFL